MDNSAARRPARSLPLTGIAGAAAALVLAGTPTASTPWQAFPAGFGIEAATTHGPLDPLTPAEVTTTLQAVEAYAKFPSGSVFPIVKLHEPDKRDVLAGTSTRREAFANVYDAGRNRLYEAVVDLKARRVVEWTLRPGMQPAQTATDYANADAIVRADARWQNAMRSRGIDPDDVYLDGWSPGEPLPAGVDPSHRFIRQVSFFNGTLPKDRKSVV